MKLTLLFSFLVIFNSALYSQPGTAGFSILKMGFAARELSLSSSADAVSSDPVAVLTNPASLGFPLEDVHYSNLTLTHQQYIANSTLDFLGSHFNAGGELGIGTSLLISSVPDIQVRTSPGPPQASFTARDFLLGVGIGKSFGKLDIGISAMYLYEKIFVYESDGLAFNAGLRFRPIENSTVGLSVGNIGSASKMAYESIALPIFLRMGGSYNYKISQDFSLTGYAGIQSFRSGGTHASFGAEIELMNMIYLRSGYTTAKYLAGMSFGTGFSYKFIRLDYSYIPLKLDFGNSQTFSLNFAL